ncbi:S-adenosyl-L-methionine-dependent methyltransferase [Aaosphaeria arxii CBS 175.79]|uniref:S-adenosyl-L-methionine-dependent methyltransferase n=1 Tax=Aaosphaeria arxii CBS 175.79 TaxID=1450172 RepID=A0A6A5XUR1_9PLEO|nr:S-adenosyl-L-methionine-dependent methyltransferase [Aaosphaeria arxii CBS 175.79]KAF2016441.1 S-adenosyl-L-methionine-dependent methyltransferase [Aaosphaeria arxii CBS 175.79]
MAETDAQGQSYEAQHVHSVYEEIASHFSSTRYKPWPIVERFLEERPDGAIGADVGCGNGKYLSINDKVFIVGSDRSTNLVSIAKQHHQHLNTSSLVVADNLSLPHPLHAFDFAISIAVIHHLSTPARRVEAVAAVLELLKGAGGRALIYVWALEQKDSRRGWDEGHEQDVMVPWVMKGKKEKKTGSAKKGRRKGDGEEGYGEAAKEEEQAVAAVQDKTFLRYYHLYRKGELEHDVEEAGGVVVESGYEKDNWWAIARLKDGDGR